MIERFESRAGVGGSAGATGVIDANGEVLTVECTDLSNMVAHVTQVVDAGTVTLAFEVSLDGVIFVAFGAALTEASFPAGANTAVERPLSDSNGMALAYRQVRVRATALAGGGSYGLILGGRQKHGFR